MNVYTVQFNGVAATTQVDFFEINASSGKPLRLLMVELSQSTEVGDAQEEGLSILIKRGASTSGSGGSTPTPVPLNPSQAASSFTAETMNTTKATSGTIVTLHASNWNVRAPYLFIPPPECRIELGVSGRLTIELGTTPADSITISGVCYIEELG